MASDSDGKLFGVGILAMIVLFIASTLATSLSDTNTTSLKEVIASAFITGFGVYVLAIILRLIGLAVPELKRLMNAFS